jgi:hypothetical protein
MKCTNDEKVNAKCYPNEELNNFQFSEPDD